MGGACISTAVTSGFLSMSWAWLWSRSGRGEAGIDRSQFLHADAPVRLIVLEDVETVAVELEDNKRGSEESRGS